MKTNHLIQAFQWIAFTDNHHNILLAQQYNDQKRSSFLSMVRSVSSKCWQYPEGASGETLLIDENVICFSTHNDVLLMMGSNPEGSETLMVSCLATVQEGLKNINGFTLNASSILNEMVLVSLFLDEMFNNGILTNAAWEEVSERSVLSNTKLSEQTVSQVLKNMKINLFKQR
eukprot:TRINITY_DN26829_c0_g1_i1.p1 TRINITY_DN26829_c0_g1~~TRINITY_DN26829_c0_g1_i1.p1  ORF type:complete len:173 (+),score=28.32 TRINITY_DN26829_c0_g1_i1:122-640(+)